MLNAIVTKPFSLILEIVAERVEEVLVFKLTEEFEELAGMTVIYSLKIEARRGRPER